ncbi:MAG: cysteine hydrolase family protein [Planctomycetota bacterium]|jgi:nicotinamidase-related amidase
MIMSLITSRWRRVVVDVDTQRHFFNNCGMVCVRNHRSVLANILRVVNWARLKNVRMISTVQIFPSKYPYCYSCLADIADQEKVSYTFRKKYASFEAVDCTDLQPGILDRYEQVIFQKRCFDPFEEPRADRMLSELQVDEFILIGALTEGAVKATALGLLSRHKNVTVLVDATGSYNTAVGNITLRLILERGGRLIDTRTFLASARPQTTGRAILRDYW